MHLALRFLSFAPKAAVLIHNAILRRRLQFHHQRPQQPQHTHGPGPGGSTPTPGPHASGNPAASAHSSHQMQLQLQAAPAWAVGLREEWVLGCEWLEMAVLTLPLALGLLAPPPSLLSRMRGVWLEVLMDGVQRVAFDQVRCVVPHHVNKAACNVLLYFLRVSRFRVAAQRHSVVSAAVAAQPAYL